MARQPRRTVRRAPGREGPLCPPWDSTFSPPSAQLPRESHPDSALAGFLRDGQDVWQSQKVTRFFGYQSSCSWASHTSVWGSGHRGLGLRAPGWLPQGRPLWAQTWPQGTPKACVATHTYHAAHGVSGTRRNEAQPAHPCEA